MRGLEAETANHIGQGGAMRLGRLQRVRVKGAHAPSTSSLCRGPALGAAGVYDVDRGINACGFIQQKCMDRLMTCAWLYNMEAIMGRNTGSGTGPTWAQITSCVTLGKVQYLSYGLVRRI